MSDTARVTVGPRTHPVPLTDHDRCTECNAPSRYVRDGLCSPCTAELLEVGR